MAGSMVPWVCLDVLMSCLGPDFVHGCLGLASVSMLWPRLTLVFSVSPWHRSLKIKYIAKLSFRTFIHPLYIGV